MKAYLDEIENLDFDALRAHLTPRVLLECTGRVHILDANAATMELFECSDRASLSAEWLRVFRREAYPALREGMVALYRGETRFSHETVAYYLKGTRGTSFSTLPSFQGRTAPTPALLYPFSM